MEIHSHETRLVKDTKELWEYTLSLNHRMNGGGSLTAPVTRLEIRYCNPNSEKCPCSDCNDMEYDGMIVDADIWTEIDPLSAPPHAARPRERPYGRLPHFEQCSAFD